LLASLSSSSSDDEDELSELDEIMRLRDRSGILMMASVRVV